MIWIMLVPIIIGILALVFGLLTGVITINITTIAVIVIGAFFSLLLINILLSNSGPRQTKALTLKEAKKIDANVYEVKGLGMCIDANGKRLLLRQSISGDTIIIHEIDDRGKLDRSPLFVSREQAAENIVRKINGTGFQDDRSTYDKDHIY